MKRLNTRPNEFSQFWLDKSLLENLDKKSEIAQLMQLASIRRAVGNFVKIVTERDIPVVYADGDMSYTDGRKVTISSRIDNGDFDPVVGLAIHEASHIKYTDFQLLKALEKTISKETYDAAEKIGIPRFATMKIIKDLLNLVEDWRIDATLYREAPGYQGYIIAQYDRYNRSETVDEGLLSTDPRTRMESVGCYMFRICNMDNENSDLTALKGLKEISLVVNQKDIMRLEDTVEAFNIADAIYHVMLKYIDPKTVEQDKKDAADRKKAREDAKNGTPQKGKGKSKPTQMGGNYFDEDGEEGETDGEIELTDDEFDNLLNAVQSQRQYRGGRIVKIKLTDEQKKKLDVLKDSKSNMQSVTVPSESKRDKCKYEVVVMKNISEAMFHSSIFPFSTPGYKHFEAEVVQGIVLGTILGKKLQIRNEEKTTLYTRKDTGRVDKRLLAEFGFGNSQVFSQSFTEKYCKAILHISIDVSGSMAGHKLGKAITTTTAICKAASMIQNLDVVVSLRGSLEGNQGRQPVIASIYDSRVDKFVKVRRWFPILTDSGLTPEGLCFAAIEKEIVSSSKELQSYFLNFSDGEPYFSDGSSIQYSGDAAARHTASEVKKMQLRGVKVLSYFISDGYGGDSSSSSQFRIMYGRSAQTINTSNMTEVARTMNKMFLSEDSKIQ